MDIPHLLVMRVVIITFLFRLEWVKCVLMRVCIILFVHDDITSILYV